MLHALRVRKKDDDRLGYLRQHESIIKSVEYLLVYLSPSELQLHG